MAIEQFKNGPETNLNGAITNVATSLTVVDASAFPTTGQFRIRIDFEIMLVTGVSSNTFTVTRAQEGTAGAAHSDSAAVTHVLTAGALDKRVEDEFIVDSIGNRPAAGKAGRLFLPTGGFVLQRDTGAAWVGYGPLNRCVQPPAVAGFSWVNQGGSTAVDDAGSIYMTIPRSNTQNLRLLVKSAPATPYTITAGFIPFLDNASASVTPHLGLVFRQSSDGKLITTYYSFPDARIMKGIDKWTSETVFSATARVGEQYFWPQQILWARIEDDGTNRKIYFGDGVHWKLLFSEGRTTFLTADQVGVYLASGLENDTADILDDVSMTLVSWEQG